MSDIEADIPQQEDTSKSDGGDCGLIAILLAGLLMGNVTDSFWNGLLASGLLFCLLCYIDIKLNQLVKK